jgi:hypothetical protein
MEPHDALIDEIRGYYTHAQEQARLTAGVGLLEYLRMCDLLARYLPPAPAAVLDIGGGSGAYALTLAKQGYLVDLVDPVPLTLSKPCGLHRRSQRRSNGLKSAMRADWPGLMQVSTPYSYWGRSTIYLNSMIVAPRYAKLTA